MDVIDFDSGEAIQNRLEEHDAQAAEFWKAVGA
jgi:hypothetical protein